MKGGSGDEVDACEGWGGKGSEEEGGGRAQKVPRARWLIGRSSKHDDDRVGRGSWRWRKRDMLPEGTLSREGGES
jgi:hypothetical protein